MAADAPGWDAASAKSAWHDRASAKSDDREADHAQREAGFERNQGEAERGDGQRSDDQTPFGEARAQAIDIEALQRLATREERRAETGEGRKLRRLAAQNQSRPGNRRAFAGDAGADDQSEDSERSRREGATVEGDRADRLALIGDDDDFNRRGRSPQRDNHGDAGNPRRGAGCNQSGGCGGNRGAAEAAPCMPARTGTPRRR